MKALQLIKLGALVFIAGCASVQTPWRLDSIAAGEAQFDSSRLLYSSPSSHLKVEFLKTNDGVRAFLFLKQHKFSRSTPNSSLAKVTLLIDELSIEELAPLREGKMRIALSEKMGEKLILALQHHQKISILLDGFKETLIADEFEKFYRRFTEGEIEIFRFVKGPFA